MSCADFKVERLGGLPVDQNFRIRVKVIDIDKVILVEGGLELLHKKLGILYAYAEHELGTDVAKDGVFDLVLELGDKLVRHRQVQAIFARFGKDGRDRIGRKVLELVYI